MKNWKGRKFNANYREFGENVLYLRPGSRGKDKFEVRWENGVWFGIADRTGESIVGTEHGVIKVRDVRSIEGQDA